MPLDGIAYFPKWAGSAFVNPDLDAWLGGCGVGCVALTGLQAKACVAAPARDAPARGYQVELIADAIGCIGDASRNRALARLERKGAWIVRTFVHN